MIRLTAFVLAIATCGCGGGGGPELAAQIAVSAYDALVAELGDDFQTQFPDPAAYPDLGWELYGDAINDVPLSWTGNLTAHELGEAYRIGDDVYYEAVSNLSGRATITINGVTDQNTRVQFSDVTEQVSGTEHNIPDLMFSLLPVLEAGTREYNLDGPSDDLPSAWIRINTYRLLPNVPDVEGTFWRHSGYSGEFEAEREGAQ
ncbi:MAG: hypothetical protein OXC38_00830 [Gammaproteobacteria bacterium]|nr:hypothetical protein [Gammaproteobacteria bacterium]